MIAKRYGSFFEDISEKTSIEEFNKLFDKNVKFKDPFHEVQGVEKVYDVFQKMYKNLENPKFNVIEAIEQNKIAYIKWKFTYKFKNEKELQNFLGVSRVEFNNSNKAILHEDFWDAAENIYEKIPLLSLFIKIAKNKIAK